MSAKLRASPSKSYCIVVKLLYKLLICNSGMFGTLRPTTTLAPLMATASGFFHHCRSMTNRTPLLSPSTLTLPPSRPYTSTSTCLVAAFRLCALHWYVFVRTCHSFSTIPAGWWSSAQSGSMWGSLGSVREPGQNPSGNSTAVPESENLSISGAPGLPCAASSPIVFVLRVQLIACRVYAFLSTRSFQLDLFN